MKNRLDAGYHLGVVAITAETPEVLPGITDSSHPQRRKWEKRSINTVVDVLENASLLSASFTPEDVKSKI